MQAMRAAAAVVCLVALLATQCAAQFKSRRVNNPDIPASSFSCKGRHNGYYADVETDCQVYHMCLDRQQFSYQCPNTTRFQQRMMICDHWYQVDCPSAPLSYSANLLIGQRNTPFVGADEHRALNEAALRTSKGLLKGLSQPSANALDSGSDSARKPAPTFPPFPGTTTSTSTARPFAPQPSSALEAPFEDEQPQRSSFFQRSPSSSFAQPFQNQLQQQFPQQQQQQQQQFQQQPFRQQQQASTSAPVSFSFTPTSTPAPPRFSISFTPSPSFPASGHNLQRAPSPTPSATSPTTPPPSPSPSPSPTPSTPSPTFAAPSAPAPAPTFAAPSAPASSAPAPSLFPPSAFSPSAPSAFAPSAFGPSAFAPSAFAPNSFAPSAFSPSAFGPSAFSPSAPAPSPFASSATAPSLRPPSRELEAPFDYPEPEGNALPTGLPSTAFPSAPSSPLFAPSTLPPPPPSPAEAMTPQQTASFAAPFPRAAVAQPAQPAQPARELTPPHYFGSDGPNPLGAPFASGSSAPSSPSAASAPGVSGPGSFPRPFSQVNSTQRYSLFAATAAPPASTPAPPSRELEAPAEEGEADYNTVEVKFQDTRRLFFIPTGDSGSSSSSSSSGSQASDSVVVIKYPSKSARHASGVGSTALLKSYPEDVKRRVDPKCPHCHPDFVVPGTCSPCVLLR